MKPDAEIYLRTADALGREPEDCLFVGDGANNELNGGGRGRDDAGSLPAKWRPSALARDRRLERPTRDDNRGGASAVLITTANDLPGYAGGRLRRRGDNGQPCRFASRPSSCSRLRQPPAEPPARPPRRRARSPRRTPSRSGSSFRTAASWARPRQARARSAVPSYSYPADGSVVTTGALHATALASTGSRAVAGASSSAANISLFDGEITADSASAGVSAATTGSGKVGGSYHGTGVVHLQALGRPHAFGRAAVGDWGQLTIAAHTSAHSSVRRRQELRRRRDRARPEAHRRPRRASGRQRDRSRLQRSVRTDGAPGGRAERARDPGRRQPGAPTSDHRPADRRAAGDRAAADRGHL